MNRTWLNTLKDEIFDLVPDTVNTKRGASSHTSQLSNLSQGIPCPGSFKDILVDVGEIPLPTERPCKVWFVDAGEGDIISSRQHALVGI